jgi:hypothetical protein
LLGTCNHTDYLHERSMNDSDPDKQRLPAEHESARDRQQDSAPAPTTDSQPVAGDPAISAAEPSTPDPSMPGATATFGLTPKPRTKTRLVDPLLGMDLGGVKIVRLLGEGGMGRVYEAVQDRPARTVAVKVIRQGILSEKTMRRFEREAEFLARLQHPGIAQIFVVGTYSSDVGEIPFYVMEYLENAKPITHYVDEVQLALPDKLRLFQKVCQAVSHGHDRGIVHRDLKPGNILIDGNGQPKVIDFGVARSTDSDLALASMRTDTGQLVGTVQYMSPEQFGAEPDDLDSRADVYALGVVFYELLAGEPPYQVKRKGIHEAAKVICEQAPVPLRSHDKTLPRDIEAIAHRCLQKDRSKRYRTAGALAHDLEQYLDGKPVSARLSGPAEALFGLRRMLSPWGSAVLAGVLVVLSVVAVTAVGTRAFFPRVERETPTREELAAMVNRDSEAPLDPAGSALAQGAQGGTQADPVSLRLTTSWNPSGLQVARGTCYRLRVTGSFIDDAGRPFGPQGVGPRENRAAIGPRDGLTTKQLQNEFVRGYPKYGVIGRIGGVGVTMFVGPELVFVAPGTGELAFCLNARMPQARTAAADTATIVGGAAELMLETVPDPVFMSPGGVTRICARVAGEEFLLFDADGLRWQKGLMFGPRAEQDFPVLVNGIAWWPDRFAPFTSALLKTPGFSWASGAHGAPPVIQMSDDGGRGAQVEAVEVKPGLRGLAFRWHGEGAGTVKCTIAKP